MSVSALRNSLCWVMVILCPLSLLSADTGAAVVHSKGGVWVNGAEVADATAIFPGDLLETKPGAVANVDADGSSILIQPQSVVKFQGNYLSLEHGGVSVGTSTSMSVHVNCIKVQPTSNARTQYDVNDLNGTVQVAARKDDVNITQSGVLAKATPENNSSQSTVVHEGQQATRDETAACGEAPRPGPASNGLNSKWIEIGGAVGGGIIVVCLLLCKSENPISPSQP
jgi:ferric-dicitrate binding protein FerR (iron transport regulator)